MQIKNAATTEGIKIEVESKYDAKHSAPIAGRWFFTYTVKITNTGERAARLMSRHWMIQNAEGEIEEVHGEGVVGRTPRLLPGDKFEYTSGCPLNSPFGSMRGSYRMHRDDGSWFDAEIPVFSLSQSGRVN